MAAIITGHKNPEIEFKSEVSGKVIRYIPRSGVHPKTNKPLTDIMIVTGYQAINWPKVTDMETGELVPFYNFDGVIEIGTFIHAWWENGAFHVEVNPEEQPPF